MRRIGAWCLVTWAGVVSPVYGQNTTTRVSVSTTGIATDRNSFAPAVSADGRYVAFYTISDELVPGDTNGREDVFVRNVQKGITERVSVGSAGVQGNGASLSPSISGDGRFVAFVSSATNLVANDTNGVADIFVRDRQTGTTTRVSVTSLGGQASAASSEPVISSDGRYVAFSSPAANFANDTNGKTDVFHHDRQTGSTIRVSIGQGAVQAMGASFSPSISADGSIIAFASDATNLVSGDTNAVVDVFLRDLGSNQTIRVSVGPGGAQGNAISHQATISFDGRFVSFESASTNLVANGRPGVYVRDRASGVTSAVLLDAVGAAPLTTRRSKISGEGGHICLWVLASTGTFYEHVVVDRVTLSKTPVNVADNGEAGNSGGEGCALNGDATIAAFDSTSSNLVANDFNEVQDVFVRTLSPSVALDRGRLSFAAVTNGGTFVSQTAAQIVRLTPVGVGTVTWTAVSTQPWLRVSPASGTGPSALSIDVVPAAGLPPNGAVAGEVVVTLTGAVNTLPPIAVTLTLQAAGTSQSPFGLVDTPTDGRTGVTGAVPFTGWALDDVEVTRVSICRAASGAEVAPIDPNCGGAAEIFVGFAVFIEGARPDVASTFPVFPLAARAGWGFMVLTNMLPNQGNGTYRFTMRAQDREGNWSVLGVRTMACANASATLPFGTLDTPVQGGAASGANFVNFGWVLTPMPKTIPFDGSTIHVIVDGVDVGTADYNHARPDIQAAFPGFNNTNGAIGFRILDTTLMTNGLHTISWTVTDNAGAIEGIGSRFFVVSNGISALTAAATSPISDEGIETAALDTTPLVGRRGWDLEAALGVFEVGANGVTVIRSEEVNRVELHLGEGNYVGHLRTPAGLAPLPIGSRLDRATNIFTWAPGVGFVGPYNFVFVQSANGRPVSRREVRIVLHPKGRGAVGPQVVIDIPRAQATVSAPFMIGGWAVDLDAAEGTGVTTLHAWAFPASGGAPIFLGATDYGGARPDVAAVHGDRFKDSGFGLIAQGLPAGDYDLAVFAWSTETMGFVAPKTVRLRVIP